MGSEEDEVKNSQVVDARARNISHNVRCTECGSQSIEDSQADIAILLRKVTHFISLSYLSHLFIMVVVGYNHLAYSCMCIINYLQFDTLFCMLFFLKVFCICSTSQNKDSIGKDRPKLLNFFYFGCTDFQE